jgi:serine/threonine protein kinase
MQPPLSSNTVLHSRYCIKKLLGQGGFGRTYLAEDQGRFNELCVLKEYIPTTGSGYALQKSKELFHREAQTLYQIQHPQVPKLHATFEENGRLFLVQDFIEGSTYRRLLDQRLGNQQVFSEWEAFRFLQNMLPVLEYIHAKGIIHRDIAPDNIILRQGDSLPVLIDFGIVKEVARVDLLEDEVENATTVGKAGYAPSEQLQTGKIYPSSDIYALAVTTIVLLTGRKSQELRDEETMTWRWHQWVPMLTPQFAQILNRMLSPKPRNRYQSAAEAAQALRTLAGLIPQTNGRILPTGFFPSQNTQITQPITSTRTTTHTRTTSAVSNVSRPDGSIIFQQQKQGWQMPEWGYPALGLGVAIAGVIALIQLQPDVVAKLKDKVPDGSSPEVQVTPRPLPIQLGQPETPPSQGGLTASPTPIAAATPTSTAVPEPTAEIVAEPITFADKTGRLQTRGRVDANRVQRYIITPESGQEVAARILEGDVATLHVRNANKSIEAGITAWKWKQADPSDTLLIDVESKIPTDYLLELSVTGGK